MLFVDSRLEQATVDFSRGWNYFYPLLVPLPFPRRLEAEDVESMALLRWISTV